MTPRPVPRSSASGFTLTELMVTVAVIGIVSAVAVTTNISQWRREQANSAIQDLSIWLNEVSNSPDQIDLSCAVTISTGTGLNAGAQLATVTPATCAREATLRLPGVNTGGYRFNVAASSTAFSFTPRGAVNSATDITVRLSVDGSVPLRCVRISGTLGLIRVGRNNTTGDTASACADWSAT